MAARCTTPPAAMHHFTGMDAPFARNQCTTFCGHTVLLGRCMHTGKLKDAVTYAQNQKAHLSAFLEHGEIEISNNQVENAIRPFVVGRKGWLFADTPQGAEASAIIYSLMETAKANSLRLDDYLLHLPSVFPERVAQRKDFEMDDLLPWSGEMKSWFSAV